MGPVLKKLAGFLAFLALLAGLGYGGRLLWQSSRSTATLASVLMEDIRSFMADASAVVTNPFVEIAVGPEPIFTSRIALEREIARKILDGFWVFHLSGAFVNDLSRLQGIDASTVESYYKGMETWARALRVPPPAPEESLGALAGSPGRAADAITGTEPAQMEPGALRARLAELARGDHRRVEEARARAPALEVDWTADGRIYCRSMLTLKRMTEIQGAQKEGCRNRGRTPSKGGPTAACSKAALLRFGTEITQLEQVRALNEKKLKQKWGPRLYARISCE